jgi:hypothetical protein
MAKNIHKGSEFNNVNETWNQNEKNRVRGNAADRDETSMGSGSEADDLNQKIKEEAAEYDQVNKEERILGGDRASLNDEPGDRNTGDE